MDRTQPQVNHNGARIGIDFGGVIVISNGIRARDDTDLSSEDGDQIAREGVWDAMRHVVCAHAGNVWIVSKAGPRMQARTREWLDRTDFYERTGLPRDHVRFCLTREDKAPICRELGITHFVDDRVHIMQILREVVPHLYLFGEQDGTASCPPWATLVTSWADLLGMLVPPNERES